jgi:hypothetical protein
VTQETRFSQHFAVDAKTYWTKLCLSLDYQERLYKEALGCTRMDVLEHDGDYERGMRRRLRFEKPLDAPSAVRKLFGDHVVIQEHSEFDPRTQCWSFRMIPSVLADHLEIQGAVTLVEEDAGVEQRSTNRVRCTIFGVGSLVEHFVAKSANEGNADKAAFTRRYIAEHGLSAPSTQALASRQLVNARRTPPPT